MADTATEIEESGGGTADAETRSEEAGRARPEGAESLSAVMLYGGKQYVISEGQDIVLPAAKGFSAGEITVNDILMARNGRTILGSPRIDGAFAALSRREPLRMRRELNFKRRRRKNSSKRTKGVRIYSMKCRVESITVPGL